MPCVKRKLEDKLYQLVISLDEGDTGESGQLEDLFPAFHLTQEVRPRAWDVVG
jgi:hypothetical protein